VSYAALPDEFPVLDVGEHVLRRIELTDGDSLFAYIGDPAVVEFMRPETRTREQVDGAILDFQSNFANKTGIRWAIARKDGDLIVGDLGFRLDALNLSAPLGYRLAPTFWGRGIATRAVREVVGYGFDMLRLKRIEATVNVANERSIRLLERVGFQREGRLRQYRLARGAFYDSYMYSLLASDR
jgi:ribosomal-protein-alanine N-acetyltransferase